MFILELCRVIFLVPNLFGIQPTTHPPSMDLITLPTKPKQRGEQEKLSEMDLVFTPISWTLATPMTEKRNEIDFGF